MGLTKPKIVGGVSLPDLTNPAGAENIQSGYDAINQNGVRVAGALTPMEVKTGVLSLSDQVKTATITDAIGKSNIAVFFDHNQASSGMVADVRSNYRVISTIMFVGGVCVCASVFRAASEIDLYVNDIRTAVTFDNTTGKITVSDSNTYFRKNGTMQYRYITW